MATPTLTEFLLARIAEDEAMALAARGDSPTPWANDGGTLKDAGNTSLAGYCGEETAAHIVRHDPDRVLAECEAKRRIVERYAYIDDGQPLILDPADGHGWDTLCDLATVFADHPDYRDGWPA